MLYHSVEQRKTVFWQKGEQLILSYFRLHLTQPEDSSDERLEDFMEEDFLWERQEAGLSERQRQENERQEKEEEKRVTETAFLVTRTSQQTLALIMVGLTILRVIGNCTHP